MENETQAGSELSERLGGALEESLIDTLVTKCKVLTAERDKYRVALEQLRDSYGSMHDDPWIHRVCMNALRSWHPSA